MKKHSLLLTVLLSLSIAVGLSNALLRGQLLGGGSGPPGSLFTAPGQSRACASQGTMFENIHQPTKVTELFSLRMNAIVDERLRLLNTPSAWSCIASGGVQQPLMPELQALADDMPGWHYVMQTAVLGSPQTLVNRKPVTWENFSSVALEFVREYECKLSELQDQAINVVLTDNDIENPDPAGLYSATLASRITNLIQLMTDERQRARTATERTINTLRSFEMHLPFTLQMHCMQRTAMDLKNTLALTADAVSCMPKIWDSVTSIHDPLPQQP